jgi:thiamine kinase-like enzyme
MLSHFHATEIPELSREPLVFQTIEKWIQKITYAVVDILMLFSHFRKKKLYSNDPLSLDAELNFLKEKLKEIPSPILFSHNDLQENNILHNNVTHELHFIDFEYSNYNYRGFDFGNHFCEWMIEYSDKLENGFQVCFLSPFAEFFFSRDRSLWRIIRPMPKNWLSSQTT